MLTLLALLVGATTPAQRVYATISPPPRPLVAGRSWSATLTVRPAPRSKPVIVARASGQSIRFGTRKIARGRYRVRIVLRAVGRWQLSARIGRKTFRLRTVNVVPQPPPTSPLPGGSAYRVCGGLGQPYLQYGLAMGSGSAWLACGRRGEVMRVDTATGAVIARVPLPVSPWSIAAGEGAIWTVALQGSTVYRIDPATNRVAAQIQLGVGVPYLWAGGGAVWAADDGGSSLLRIDPGTNQVVASIPVGNGPAGFAFDGTWAWVLNHRENTLDQIDRATNTATRTAFALGAENVAAERIALFGGDLWVTGRGLDVVRVSRPSGAIIGRTEIGTGGIDVRTDGTSMWVASYEAAADARGEPIAEALLKVDATGGIVRTVVPSRLMHADGLAVADGSVWVFDGIAGLLVRLPA